MAMFIYKARTARDEMIADQIEADNEAAAIRRLQERGYFPITISEKGKDRTGILPLTQRIRPRDVTLFTRQMADLISSGLPLAKGLDLLSRQGGKRELREIITGLNMSIRDGISFSGALSLYPRVFSRLYIGMIKAGEMGGGLSEVLTRLADFYERQEELKSRVRSAMTYPLIMAIVGSATIFFLLTFVIPRFAIMFEDIGEVLPLPTRMLMGTSLIFAKFWWILLAGFILIFFILNRYSKTEKGRLAFDRFKLNIPILGKVMQLVVIARFSRTLGTLIHNGVPILTALDMTRQTVGNEVVAKEIVEIHNKVREGKHLASCVGESKVFSETVAHMIGVGEEAGNLEDVLIRIADLHDKRVNNYLRAFISSLEPITILVMAVAVGFIVMSMLLPIFKMGTLIE